MYEPRLDGQLKKSIFLSPPCLNGAEAGYLKEAIESNWVAPAGPQLSRFEEELSRLLGGRSVAAVASGTAALHLALLLLKVQPGDTVIVSTFTFAASANPIKYEKAQPYFIDAEDRTWNLDPELLEEAVQQCIRRGRPPRAVIAVELYGMPYQADAVAEVCDRFGIPLIEDAAEALGSRWSGKPAGSLGDVSMLSFNGNKIVTTSGGGAIVADDAALIQQARHLATQARDPAPWYQHSKTGYNYRMSNLLAAVGCGQLEQLPEFVSRRRDIFRTYQERLGRLPGVRFLAEPDQRFHSNRWLSTVLLDRSISGVGWQEVHRALAAENIESRPLWKPLHLQPAFQECPKVVNGTSERLFAQGLCLPSGSGLGEDEIDRVCGIIEGVLGHAGVGIN